jgi:calcineurin-like phosphoesterase family protein
VSVFFTADLHFGHERIVEFHPARGSSLDEMHERLVDGWRSVVGRSDEVWVLGDFAMGKLDDSLKFFHALPGKKHLIRGNHDGPRTVRLPWSSVSEYREWRQKPHKAVLSHYPFLTWNAAHYGVWMLHGHSHGLLATSSTTRMDVGVDTHAELRPYALEEIAQEMAIREYVAVDGHAREVP